VSKFQNYNFYQFCQISNRKVTFNNHFEIILTPL